MQKWVNNESNLVKSGLPCPDCGSSDALAEYDDGHTYCFSCRKPSKGKTKRKEKVSKEVVTELKSTYQVAPNHVVDFNKTVFRELPSRKITKDTCEFYQVSSLVDDEGRPYGHVYPLYNEEGELAARKIREKSKDFHIQKKDPESYKKTLLFGQQLFPKGSAKYITVTEGELDALAVYQMSGSKFPVISIKNGAASASADLKRHLEYLESFENVFICFDNDKVGRDAAKAVVDLFSPGKAKIVNLTKHKDPCDYLKNDDAKKFVSEWWAAESYTPEGLVLSSSLKEKIREKTATKSFAYPWSQLNQMTFGLREGELVVFTAPPKVGKCFGKGTRVLMFDGSVKNVEDVKNGDLVMGDDSTPRLVEGVTTGVDTLYKITPKKGDSFVVNKSHILSLVSNKLDGEKEYTDISLEEYLAKSDNFKKRNVGYRRSCSFKTVYDNSDIHDPYIFGLWLGDGDSGNPVITTEDQEIVDYLEDFTEKHSLSLAKYGKNRYAIVKEGKNYNPYFDYLDSLNVLNNKHIPDRYSKSSEKDRLTLLAGLLDSDGYLHKDKSYEITQKNYELAKSVWWIARTLGFYSSLKKVKKSCWYKGVKKEGVYYRVCIYGQLHKIPCRVERKIQRKLAYRDSRNFTFDVEELGKGEYFGFVLSGNHRFLLEDCTVVHNTQVMRELTYNLLTENPEVKIGGLFIEETPEISAEGLMSLYLNKRIHLPDTEVSEEEWNDAFDKVLADDRLVYFDAFGCNNVDTIIKRIRWMNKAYGCQIVILDHISMLAADHRGDERASLDYAALELKKLTMETGLCIVIVAHENREGKIHGTSSIEKLANLVVEMDRDKVHSDPLVRSTVQLLIQFNRFTGETGPAGFLFFDKETGRLSEIDPEEFYERKKGQEEDFDGEE